MRVYRNVIFDHYDDEILQRAARHLPVAFPDMNTEMPRKTEERLADHGARIISQLIADKTIGTYENLTRAMTTLKKSLRVLNQQADLTYWLDLATAKGAPTLEVSDDPLSDYQHLRTLSQLRDNQATDTVKAIDIIHAALHYATPADPQRVPVSAVL